jgi:hypothetical protein
MAAQDLIEVRAALRRREWLPHSWDEVDCYGDGRDVGGLAVGRRHLRWLGYYGTRAKAWAHGRRLACAT